MKIHFERSGGFTAIPVRLALDTALLEPGDAAELIRLVAESQFNSLPEKTKTLPGTRDHFQYRLEIESEGNYHVVETSESSAPEALLPLLRHLTLLARSRRTSS